MLVSRVRYAIVSRRPNLVQRVQTGFTLTELLVVVALLAILAFMAVPNIRRTVETNALDAAVAEFRTQLARTRAEAITRGTTVTLAPISFTGSSPDIRWSRNFRVWVNPLNQLAFVADQALGASGTDRKVSELLLDTSLVDNERVRIVGATATNISYLPDGRSVTVNGSGGWSSAIVTTVFCIDPTSVAVDNARRIEISIAGRVAVTKETHPCPV